jgi:hypothetical protein
MATFAALLLAGGCGLDGGKPVDSHARCAEGAALTECGSASLTGAEDACWRLVQCSAIPVTNPESDPSCCFDWAECVARVGALPDEQFESALACIEAATCDELRGGAAPADEVSGRPGELPGCLDLGQI